MDIVLLTEFFKWCSIINFGFLLYIAAALMLFPGFIYEMHSRFFTIPRETFDVIIYSFVGLYKIVFFCFNLIPYVALRLIG
jgi:uncharacterized protein DUF6868